MGSRVQKSGEGSCECFAEAHARFNLEKAAESDAYVFKTPHGTHGMIEIPFQWPDTPQFVQLKALETISGASVSPETLEEMNKQARGVKMAPLAFIEAISQLNLA